MKRILPGKVAGRLSCLLMAGVTCISAALYSRMPAGTAPDLPEYPFIRTDKNKIIRADTDAMQHFYHALDSLQRGSRKKVNVVHLGDSHVQADFFSGKMRENFYADSLTGNGGRGLVFPGSLIRTNNPYNVKVSYTGHWTGCRIVERLKSCDWGITGMTATTSDSAATFTINPNTSPGYTYPISGVKIFYETYNPDSYGVTLLSGDSTVILPRLDTPGIAEFVLESPLPQVTIRLQKKAAQPSPFGLQGVVLENDLPGLQYHAAGVNGAEVLSFLRTSPLLESQLQELAPDLVIISLGTNDAYLEPFDAMAFRQHYTALVQRIRNASPRASVLLTTPGDCYRSRKYANSNNARAAAQIIQLAEATGSAVWNFYEVMGGLRSVVQWQASELATKDRLHLTRKGYELQADLLYEALMDDFQAYRMRSRIISDQLNR
jgi:lysophospholipase L1-like esterase